MFSPSVVAMRMLGRSAIAALAAFCFSAVAAEPKVVATIAPLHSLVWAVTEGVTDPVLLLPSTVSPHNFQLRPSQIQLLADADIIFWIGPHFESFLARSLSQAGLVDRQVALSAVETLHQLANRESASWHHEHDSEPLRAFSVAQAHPYDPHIWLDPINAGMLVDEIARRMGELNPDNLEDYRRNAERYKRRLEELDRHLDAALEPVRHLPFLVFHDAYHHFEYRYGLRALGAITVAPDRQPGARHLTRLRRLILEDGVHCVFHEPQFTPRLIDSVADETGVRTGVLDAIGVDLPEGPLAYLRLMERNAAALVECLRR